MKTTYLVPTACMAAILTGIFQAQAGVIAAPVLANHPSDQIILKIGERLFFPPRDPSGTAGPKLTEEAMQKAVDERLKSRFEAASGSSSKLTAQQAKDAGWGFIADHFAEIDRDRTGFITFSDISRYMAVRSPIQPKQAPTPVQIIE